METINYESDIIEKQITMSGKDSEEKPKCYNFDEAIDLAGELKHLLFIFFKHSHVCCDNCIFRFSQINYKINTQNNKSKNINNTIYLRIHNIHKYKKRFKILAIDTFYNG